MCPRPMPSAVRSRDCRACSRAVFARLNTYTSGSRDHAAGTSALPPTCDMMAMLKVARPPIDDRATGSVVEIFDARSATRGFAQVRRGTHPEAFARPDAQWLAGPRIGKANYGRSLEPIKFSFSLFLDSNAIKDWRPLRARYSPKALDGTAELVRGKRGRSSSICSQAS